MDLSNLLYGIIDTAIYSLVGIIMMAVGFLIINFLTPFSVKKEIEDDQNTSLGIIIGSVIIGISIIIAAVISSPSSNTGKAAAPKTEMKTDK
jgi:putative membrane protein